LDAAEQVLQSGNEGLVLRFVVCGACRKLEVARLDPKVVQERLGHSTISLTLDTHSHVLPSLQEEVTDKLDALLQ